MQEELEERRLAKEREEIKSRADQEVDLRTRKFKNAFDTHED